MRRFQVLGGMMVAVGCLHLGSHQAEAQYPSYPQPSRPDYAGALNRPTVSPYLNLLRPNAGGLTNYYTLVRPELQQQATNQQQRYAIGRLQQDVDRMGVTGQGIGAAQSIRATGHMTRFLDMSHYYGGASGNFGGPAPRGAAPSRGVAPRAAPTRFESSARQQGQ